MTKKDKAALMKKEDISLNSIFLDSFLPRWLAIFFLIAFTNFNALAQNESLKIELILPKNEFLLDEWLTVKVVFTNTGNDVFRLAPFLEPEYGRLRFMIFDNNGNKIRYRPFVLSLMAWGRSAPTVDILPQKSYSAIIDLSLIMKDGKRFSTCLKTGSFRLQAEYRVNESLARTTRYTPINAISEITAYSVIRPTGIDAKAHNLFAKNHELSPWYVSDVHKNSYDRILAQYPHSIYAKFSLFYQALCIEVAAKGRTIKSTNKYEQIINNYSDFPLKYMLREQLMHSYLELGEIDKAQKIIDEIKSTAEDDYSKFKAERELEPAVERELGWVKGMSRFLHSIKFW